MRISLYLFNPDNDLALANGDVNFVPPRQALKMAYDLAILPAWYVDGCAAVWVPDVHAGRVVAGELFEIWPGVRITGREEMDPEEIACVEPWGWNPMLVNYLRKSGIAETVLPNDRQMGRIREYAHRSFSVRLLKELAGSEYFCGSAECFCTVQQVKNFVEQTPRSLLKAPWSGSGKGLFWGEGEYTYLMDRWVRNVLEKQQGVVAEKVYDKVEDIAMEFYSDGKGKCRFAGYSLFQTDNRGVYKRNIMALDGYIQDRLSRYVPADLLLLLSGKLEKRLSDSVGTCYRGYLGVDMMVCRFGEKPFFRIHPCVEINLRMNMGMVSRLIYDRIVLPGKYGFFSVDYFKSSTDLLKDHREAVNRYPLVVQDGKIVSGYLSLTPVGEDTNYRASIRIGETDYAIVL